MKKLRIIALIFCAMFSGVMLVACGAGNNPKAEFSESEIVLSKDETIDFLQFVETQNVDKDNLSVEIIPQNLFDKVNDTYKAVTRGRGSVQIKYEGHLLASCPVIVKQKFITPQNIMVDDKGVITWDEAYVYDEGDFVSATNYILKLNNEEIPVSGKSYNLDSEGSFEVQVKAVGSKYIDDSDYSQPVILNYNVMPSAEIESVVFSEMFGGQSLNLRWLPIADAKYNIEFDGFVLAKGQSENYITLDCHGLNAGQSADVIIEVVDTSDKSILTSRTRFNITKLATPEIKYENGEVNCSNLDGASAYSLQYIQENGVNGVVSVSPDDFSLDRVPSRALQLNVQARGSVNGNQIFASSEVTGIEIYKLEEPTFNYQLLTSGLQLKFDKQNYIENYKIVYGDHELIYNLSSGNTLILPISAFSEGENEVKVYAMPTITDELVVPYEGHESVTASSPRRVYVYVLAEGKNVAHNVEGKTIKLAMDAVRYADTYSVAVNGSTFNGVIESGRVIFEIDLSQVAPINQKYNFDIISTRSDNMAVLSHTSYTLTVLDKVSSSIEQENGHFKWNKLSQDAKYRYEIYSVDAGFDVNLGVLPEPIYSSESFDGEEISETLEFGYYVIKVYTVSTGGQYLDSDFYDENNILKVKFYVEKQIESAEFEFVESGNNYSLTITKVDYAQKYSIYIDGVLEGDVYDNNALLPSLVYNFTSNFASAKEYEITVIASAGTRYDGTIHTPSEKSVAYVTRLARPTYEVDEDEYMTIAPQPNSIGVVIKLGQDILNPNNEMGIDLSGYNDDFVLSVQAKAKVTEDNKYYLDSQEVLYCFKRVSAPSGISYNTGILSFESVDHDIIDKYIISITLVNEINGDYPDITTCTTTSFNIAQYIQSKLVSEKPEDEMFASAYKQCSSIKISVSAYAFGNKTISSTQVYLLPSGLGTTTAGLESLELRQLDNTSITFDTSTSTLTWIAIGNNQTRYSVYANGQLVKENLIGESVVLDELDFSTPTEIYVFAVNPSYLSSTSSNLIIVEKLSPVDRVNVDNANSIVYFTVDTSKVDKVFNGEDELTIGSNGYISLALSGDTTFTLKLIAKPSRLQGTTTLYFIDSEETNYTFKNLQTSKLNLSLSDGLLTWNEVATDFTASPRPLTYSIEITGVGGQGQIIEGLTICEYNLDDEVLYRLAVGEYSLKVVAKIADYSIFGGDNALGYYSYKESNALELAKLRPVASLSHKVVENSDFQKQTDKLSKAIVQFVWQDIWSDTNNVSFNIEINDDTSIQVLKAGDRYERYSLSLEDGFYTFTISNNYFISGENVLSIVVNGDSSITSNAFTYNILRYNNISSLSISDDGILEIKVAGKDELLSNKIKNFMVGVTIGGQTTYQSFDSRTINIMTKDLLGLGSGNYSVEVVGYDENCLAIPTELIASLSGYRLNGINSVQILDSGDIEITLYNENEIDNEIRFVASYNSNIYTFAPTRVENSATFVYSMEDFVKLLNVNNFSSVNMSVSVQKQGAINADFVSLAFEYAEEPTVITYTRGRNYAEDYIKIPLLSNDNTTAFRVEMSYLAESGITSNILHTYQASELRGYWLELGGSGYFVKELPSPLDAQVKVEECYALLVNEFASVLQNGQFTLRVSRVAYEDGVYKQFNSSQHVYTKLSIVSGLSLRDDTLSWNASLESEALGYYIYVYYNNGENLFGMYYTPSASLDLMTIDFIPNVTYSLRVVTVSLNNNVIASNEVYNSNSEITKYSAPASLQVKDGRIMFNEDAVKNSDLLTTIAAAYNQSGSQEAKLALINRSYSDLFTFSPSNISSMMLRLIFTRNGINYVARVSPVSLLPDLSKIYFDSDGVSLSYIKALDNMLYGVPASSQNGAFVRLLYNEIVGKNGIATNEIMFDSFASNVPAGQYTLSARQEGITRFNTITSELNVSINVAVGAAPSITLSSDVISGKNHYYISFLSSNIKADIASEAQKATGYILAIRNDNNAYYFKISYNGDDGYTVDSVEGSENKAIGLKLSTTLVSGNESIILDFSDLIPIVDMIKGSYSMTIYTIGNDYTINSKTDEKTLTLLEIDPDSLMISNGTLSWSGTVGYRTQLIYKKTNQAVSAPIEIASSQGAFVLELDDSGLYDYIILSILGSTGANSMTIDSDSYKLENVYKLASPNVSVNANKFVITDNTANNRYNTQTQFVITNDNYQGNTPYISERSTNKQIEYIAGSTSQNGDYAQSEENANEFYFGSLGSANVKFTASERQLDGDSDFILTPQNGEAYILLSSDYTTKQASLLKQVESISLVNGDFTWQSVEDKDLPSEAVIIYRIDVEFYKEGQTEPSSHAVFYTDELRFDTLNIQNPDANKYTYTLGITVLGMVAGSTRVYDIVTVNGGYYSYKALTFNDGAAILSSRTKNVAISIGSQTTISVFEKAAEVSSFAIVDGKINLATTQSNLRWQLVDGAGRYVATDKSSNSYNSNLEAMGIAPKLTFENNPYSLYVYNYIEGNTQYLKSNLIMLNLNSEHDVYKLPSVENGNFEIVSSESAYKVDLSNLYSNKRIFNTDNYYQVKMTITITLSTMEGTLSTFVVTGASGSQTKQDLWLTIKQGETGLIAEGSTITIPSGATSIKASFELFSNEAAQTHLLLNGDITEFDITPLRFSQADSVVWNSELNQFEWTLSDDNAGESPLFGITIYYDGQTSETAETSTFITRDNKKIYIYQPKQMGQITGVEIQARKNASAIYSLSPLRDDNLDVSYTLFAGGNGTQENPYLITTAEHFVNMKYRNSAQYYFRQERHLELPAAYFAFDEAFYGHYDGNDRNLTFVSEIADVTVEKPTLSLQQSFVSGASTTPVTFTQASAVFQEIARGATVENIRLFVVNNRTIDENTILSGLSYINRGQIDNVTIVDVQNTISFARSEGLALAHSLIAAVNYGTINDVTNNANLDINFSATEANQLFISPIVITNQSANLNTLASMTRCFNNGEISVTAKRRNSLIWLAGVALNNVNGRILQCGNNASLQTIDTSISGRYTSYIAGVTLRFDGGTLNYCYNKGKISSTSTISNNFGGVAYTLNSGSIAALVEASQTYIANTCLSSVNNTLVSYCHAEYPTNNINAQVISANIIRCDVSHNLVIEAVDGGFDVYIQNV